MSHLLNSGAKSILLIFCLFIYHSNALYAQNNVGIGTTLPESLLHVKNANTNANGSQLIIEGNSGYGSSTTSAIEFRSNFASGGAGPSGRIRSFYTSNNFTDAKTTFQTIGPGPAFIDAMTLTNGRVGIGTTNPATARLVIATNPGETGIDLASSDAYAEMRIIRNTLGTADKNLYLGFNALPGSAIHLYSEGLTPAMTIKSNNVGIGIEAPAQKLDVNGNVNISGSIINEAWQIPSLQNNWINYGSGLATAAYYKDKERRVHLKGTIKNGTSETLYVLPPGYRPSENLFFLVPINASFGVLIVASDGRVLLGSFVGNAAISTDIVSFRAEQ